MERVRERLEIARKALATLQELTGKRTPTAIERDAAIQRFEYTFEATWKAAQLYLNFMEGLIANSPKSTVRNSWQTGLFNEETAQHALQMCEARNMTVHTYNEKIAVSIYNQIEGFVNVLETWLNSMEDRLGK